MPLANGKSKQTSRLQLNTRFKLSLLMLASSVALATCASAQEIDLNGARRSEDPLPQPVEPTDVESDEVSQDSSIDSSLRNADLYKVPDTTEAVRIVSFINEVMRFEPRTLPEFRLHIDQGSQAVSAAADKLMELAPTKESPFYQVGRTTAIRAQMMRLPFSDAESKQAAIRTMDQLLLDFPIDAELYGIASGLTRILEQAGDTDLAIESNQRFGELFIASEDEKIVVGGERLIGAARRLQLLGQPLELEGETLDGETFAWDGFANKTVLVYFWSTAIGPAEIELPELQTLAEEYADDGFAVVAVSLDDRRRDAAEFFEKKSLTFPCLFADGAGWTHPMAIRYGISKLPTGFLVAPDGNVIATDARGMRLKSLLSERFEQ